MRSMPLIASVISVIGLILVTVGVALVFIPAAFMFAGGALALFGLVGIDVNRTPKGKP